MFRTPAPHCQSLTMSCWLYLRNTALLTSCLRSELPIPEREEKYEGSRATRTAPGPFISRQRGLPGSEGGASLADKGDDAPSDRLSSLNKIGQGRMVNVQTPCRLHVALSQDG